jgi:hypothetical protein
MTHSGQTFGTTFEIQTSCGVPVFRCQLFAIGKEILAFTFIMFMFMSMFMFMIIFIFISMFMITIYKDGEPFMADVRVCLKSEE